MRFLQTGDIHIGECRKLDARYLDRYKSVLSQITSLCVEKSLPLIIAGDLYHSPNITYDERLLGDWWLGDLERNKIPTVLIAGNHDHKSGEFTTLDGYKHMPFQYVKVIAWQPELVKIGQTTFLGLSWHNYSKQDIEQIVNYYKTKLTADTKYFVPVLHELIYGSKFDGGLISPKGMTIPIIPEVTYWAIGDIHKHQPTNVKNGYYAGAPMQFKFGDDLEKGIIEVDLENPTKPPKFHRLNSKPLKIVSNIDEVNDDAYYMLRGDFSEVIKGHKNANVIKTDWVKTARTAISSVELSLTEGLTNFLADKGIDEEYQKVGQDWVNNITKGM